MFRTTLKDLRARKLRLLTTSLAVLLGVAFMAGTLVLTDTIGKTFDGLFANANAGTDVYVRGETAFSGEMGDERARLDVDLVDTISSIDGVAAAEGTIEAYAQMVDKDGDPIGNPAMGAPTFGGSWITNDDLNPFDLDEGRAPQADHEVVIDRGTATVGELALGDSTTVLTQAGPQAVEIVGIATFGGEDSPGGSSYTFFTTSAAQSFLTEPGKIDAIAVVARDGYSSEELRTQVADALPQGTEVLTGAEITAEQQSDIKQDLGFFNTFLLAFAAIALFVGSFIIYNSFSILVAQRTKQMALLRAVGASRRQVVASVLMEATMVGLVASLVGLAAGVGVASMLMALLNAVGIDIPAGSVVVTARTVVTALVAGLGVSVASAVFPAIKASKVPPIAAMRDVAIDTSANSSRRVVIGLGVTALGAVAIAGGLFADAGIAMVAVGAAVVFVGVAVLGPVIARPMSRVIGWPLPRVKGMAGTLARENAMRNPKRTSATAAALMIGVALVGFITILASSTKASIDASIDKTFTGDFVVDSGSFDTGGLSPTLATELATLPQIDAVTGLRMVAAEVDGSSEMLLGADPATLSKIIDVGVTEGSITDLGATEIGVLDDTAKDKGLELGDTVPVRFAETGVQQLTVAAIYSESDLAGSWFLGLPAIEANVADQFDMQVLVTIADGVSPDQARAAITDVADAYPQAKVQDRTEFKAAQSSQIDMILNLIYALLGLAVLIALLGIANTLALSIFERTRELGLLRAVGMTRRQLRTTVRWEAVIIALLGTTLGLAIGTAFGWALVQALSSQGLSTFTVPAGQMALVAVIAAVAGVAAAILPARRASKLNVLQAITAD